MATIVVLCSHNGDRFVREQIDSIRHQSQPVDAIHVFDFRSTDSTRNILENLANDGQAPPVFVHAYSDAPGASMSFLRAFNEIAAIADPMDCIFLSDQDDIWLSNKIERMRALFDVEMAQQANAMVAVFHDVAIVDRYLTTTSPTFYTGDPFRVPRDLAPDRLLLANPVIGHTIGASAALLKLVSKHITREAYCMHDWALILVASRIGRIAYENTALSLYRQHDTNVLGAFRRRSVMEVVGRTFRFAQLVTRQAVAFGRDINMVLADPAINSRRVPQPCFDRWLTAVSYRAPRAAPLLLSIMALTRGPTWRRRALGAALFLSTFTKTSIRGDHE